ncbi:hypothetical protein X778_10120 [Pseudomonas aeruginosa VRFPA07]|nr:hypothetical protein X778_10120 [Pseudomonas aeruginosa VRFPA07]
MLGLNQTCASLDRFRNCYIERDGPSLTAGSLDFGNEVNNLGFVPDTEPHDVASLSQTRGGGTAKTTTGPGDKRNFLTSF